MQVQFNREIDYEKVVQNLADMINTLEYDSMRSPGKAKINAVNLAGMYTMYERYMDMLTKSPKKKEG